MKRMVRITPISSYELAWIVKQARKNIRKYRNRSGYSWVKDKERGVIIGAYRITNRNLPFFPRWMY